MASTHFTQDPVSTYSFWPGTWAGGTQPLLRLHNANLGHLGHMLAPYPLPQLLVPGSPLVRSEGR